jgi:hypothetical protein
VPIYGLGVAAPPADPPPAAEAPTHQDPADQLAIERLLRTYARRIDAGDFAGVGALFALGTIATEDGTALATGAAAVEALYLATTRRYDDGTPHTKHVTTNAVVDVDPSGDRAECHSYFTVFQGLADFPLQAIISGRYVDTFERVDGAWRFAERRMVPELYGDLSRHLLIDL